MLLVIGIITSDETGKFLPIIVHEHPEVGGDHEGLPRPIQGLIYVVGVAGRTSAVNVSII